MSVVCIILENVQYIYIMTIGITVHTVQIRTLMMSASFIEAGFKMLGSLKFVLG